MTCLLGGFLLLGQSSLSAAVKMIVIGDSLSAEYESITGVAGVDDPTEYGAITVPNWESMSWVEVLGRLRPDSVDLGAFQSSVWGWGPMRFSGYEYNFAIPGFTAAQFSQVVRSSFFSFPLFIPYRLQLARVIEEKAEVVVVWLGANEFRAHYGSIYDGVDASGLIESLIQHVRDVLEFVRRTKPAVKLLLVNLPDLGATPSKQTAHPDASKRHLVTMATQRANEALAELAREFALPVADAFSQTQPLARAEPAWIGPVRLAPGLHPDNHPGYAFTRDGLHPNVSLQGLVAQQILATVRPLFADELALISNRELLHLARLDPLQEYLQWGAQHGLKAGSLAEDPDADGWSNLAEFLFDLDPTASSPSPLQITRTSDELVITGAIPSERLRVVRVEPQWSRDLRIWLPEPALAPTQTPTRVVTRSPLAHGSAFFRLHLSLPALD